MGEREKDGIHALSCGLASFENGSNSGSGFLDNLSVKASYPDVSFSYPRSLFAENVLNQNHMFPGYNFHSSNTFQVNGREDRLGFEMQNPYAMNAPLLKDYVYGNTSARFLMLNERMRRESSSLGNHQAFMIGDKDDSIILGETQKRMGLVKSLHKTSASQDDGTFGLGISGSISYIAKTQLGCRLLQRMLNQRKYQDVQLIFNDVINHVPQLSLDPFGNYLVQKLLEVCNEEQITQVVRVLTRNPGEGIRICKNSHGTRVVQKIIQKVKTRQQIALVLKALEAGFLDLITDVNGNHVLQQCLNCFTEEHNKFIFEGAAKFCSKIATHRYGCCVLNQCIAHSSRRYREKLVTEVCANGLLLAQDSFGNYVIQNILELKIPSAAIALLSALKGHFVLLSMQKCGSHVVEKCLRCCEQSRPIIIHELLSASRFGQLLQHPFANYVIQSALQVTKGPIRSLLVKAVQPYKSLNTNPYCKKIFSTNLLKK